MRTPSPSTRRPALHRKLRCRRQSTSIRGARPEGGRLFVVILRQRGSLMTTRNSPELWPEDCCGLPGPADGALLEFALPGLFADILPVRDALSVISRTTTRGAGGGDATPASVTILGGGPNS